MAGLTAHTRLYALLGDPVAHSLSPTFQNAAVKAAGLDAVYVALRCDPSALPGLLRGIVAAGGGGNVTVPHKELAFQVVDRRTAAAEQTAACNTFWMSQGELWGDNTDVKGFAAAVQELIADVPRGLRVLVLGAGGAARAAVCALLDWNAQIVLVNRSQGRAEALAAQFGRPDLLRVTDRIPEQRFDLAVNATSLGLREDDPLPLPDDVRFGAALDLVYKAGQTRWVRRLRTLGTPAADGREMLLKQGAAAFRRWFNREPDIEVMRRALGEVA